MLLQLNSALEQYQGKTFHPGTGKFKLYVVEHNLMLSYSIINMLEMNFVLI